MLHVVDFRTAAGDTGRFSSSDSIQPVADGESADQAVLRRPTENVRARSDELRGLLRGLVMKYDFHPGLYGGGTITSDLPTGGSGVMTFTITEDLYALPYATAGGDTTAPYLVSTKSALSIGTPSTNELVFTSVQKAAEGAGSAGDVNRISVEINDGGAGASLAITVTSLDIVIQIDEGVHTCTQVINLVTGDAPASLLVTCALGSGSTGVNTAPSHEAWSNYEDRFLRGGVPGLAHLITAAGLVSFFSVGANELLRGDTLAINYDKIFRAATTGGRLQSTPENTNINVDSALFNTRRYPEYVPNCIPICKRADPYDLIFFDGTLIREGHPAQLSAGSLANTNAQSGPLTTPLNWDRIGDGPDHNPPTTIREALDNADGRINEVSVVLTVGATGSGCMYAGPSALKDAVKAIATVGGRIIVRKGTYTWDENVVITGDMQIIGIEEDIIVTCSLAAGYMLAINVGTLGPRGADTVISGLIIQPTTNARTFIVGTGATRVTFKDIYVQGGSSVATEGVIHVNGTHVVCENLHLQPVDADGITVSSSGALVTVDNYRFDGGAGTGLDIEGVAISVRNYFYLSAGAAVKTVSTTHRITIDTFYVQTTLSSGDVFDVDGTMFCLRNGLIKNSDATNVHIQGTAKNAHLKNVRFELDSAVTALAIDTQIGAVLENIEIDQSGASNAVAITSSSTTRNVVFKHLTVLVVCDNATDTPICNIEGLNHTIATCRIRVAAVGEILRPVVVFKGYMIVEGLDIDLQNQEIRPASAARCPIQIIGSGGRTEVRNLQLVNLTFVAAVSTQWTPAVCIYGNDESSVGCIRGGLISNMSVDAISAHTVVGCSTDGTANAPPDGIGAIEVYNLHINSTGFTTGSAASTKLIGNLTNRTIIRDCGVLAGTGSFSYVIQNNLGASKIQVVNNDIDLPTSGNFVSAIVMGPAINHASYRAHYVQCCNNTIRHHNASGATSPIVHVKGYAAANKMLRPRICNNMVSWIGGAGWSLHSIDLENVDKGVVHHNTVSDAINYVANVTAMNPPGVGSGAFPLGLGDLNVVT